MTRAFALLIDFEQESVAVAVVESFADILSISRCLPLAPEFLAGTAPVPHATALESSAQSVFVHPRHHQHLACRYFLGDDRHQPVAVVADGSKGFFTGWQGLSGEICQSFCHRFEASGQSAGGRECQQT